MATAKKKAKKESGFEMLARLIKEEGDDIRKDMATKEDLKRFATKEDLKRFATKEDLKRFATKEDIAQIRRDMATKVGLEEAEERIIAKFAPLEKAFDKDALTVIDHGTRIEAIESVLNIKPAKPWTSQK